MVMPRRQIQDLLAKCYIAIAEVDYDLREWRKDIGGHRDYLVEIGGQVMTGAQFNAARYPFINPDPGPIRDGT